MEILSENEVKEKKIDKAYNYVKKTIRNIYKQHFGKRWNGRFGKEARKNFILLFNDEVENEIVNGEGNPTEKEVFERVMNYIYASGCSIFMLMLQDDYISEGCFL